MLYHSHIKLHPSNLRPTKCPITTVFQTQHFGKLPWLASHKQLIILVTPSHSQQHSSTPHTVHPCGNYSNGSHGKLLVGKYLFLASCNEVQQLGRRSWKYHMTINSQQNSGLCLHYGDVCGCNESSVFPLCRGALSGSMRGRDKAELPPASYLCCSQRDLL